jgi:hypothetical protein
LPNHCKSWGSIQAKSSISNRPATKKAGQTIHITLFAIIMGLLPKVQGLLGDAVNGKVPVAAWFRACTAGAKLVKDSAVLDLTSSLLCVRTGS